ncbi:MAG: Gfo/Idh/MocA family oxidoreductase [bacterium]|nr:Gfo/Idh/MocA family oxidoreductase [Candidatus Sumerlaeota bacterium]
MSKLTAGVIGAGSIGNVHLSGYAASPKLVTIKAICDVNPARLKIMGEQYKVAAEHLYTDHKKMLAAEKLDMVSVCTPNVFHYPIAFDAIKSGVNTLVEKPMVATMAEARALKALAARRKDVKVMVAFSHRFFGMNMTAKKMIDRGVIGCPFMIRVRYAHGGPYPGWAQSDWFYHRKYAVGGALLDMGIHAIDICQYFIGPIKSVAAIVKTLRKPIEVDDNAVMALDFGAAKCLGCIECGWTSPPGFSGIEIYGDKGSLILDLVNGPKHIHGVARPDGSVETVTDPIPVSGNQYHWGLQLESWVKYVAGKKTVTEIPGIEAGCSSLAVALAAMESSKTGKRMNVKSA